MNIEQLYENEPFNNLLVMMANEKRIAEFDDFRQDVFLEIVDTEAKKMDDYKRCAWRAARRAEYNRVKKPNIDIMSLSFENENGELETDDETMSRLVYHGQGRYV